MVLANLTHNETATYLAERQHCQLAYLGHFVVQGIQ